MNHETLQFNFAALDSKPAAEVLCAQLDAECATCLKRLASTRLRLLNRLTVTRCYLRNLPMLWLPKFLPTKVCGSCHGQCDQQKGNLAFCDESALVWVYCLIPLFDWSDLRHVTPRWLTSRHATEDLGQVGVVCTLNWSEMDETKVIYHIDDEDTPYLVKLPKSPAEVTLSDFKNVLNRPSYKFFFKSMDDDFGWVCVPNKRSLCRFIS